MTLEEFAKAQQEWARPALSSLVQGCERRYLRAANLLQARGDAIRKLEKASRDGGNDLRPLLPCWHSICARYREERYDSQAELFRDHDKEILDRWSEFVYWELLPAIYREDECVRNVLRALGLLPSRSADGAADALVRFIEDMTLPSRAPLTDPTEAE